MLTVVFGASFYTVPPPYQHAGYTIGISELTFVTAVDLPNQLAVENPCKCMRTLCSMDNHVSTVVDLSLHGLALKGTSYHIWTEWNYLDCLAC